MCIMLLVPPTSLNTWPTDYFIIWSLGTLPPQNVELVMLMYFVCSLCSSLFGRVDNDTTRIFTAGGQWSDQPVAYCPARPPELIRSHPSFVSAPPRAFVFQLQFHHSSFIPPVSSRLPFVILYTSNPRLSTEALYPSL